MDCEHLDMVAKSFNVTRISNELGGTDGNPVWNSEQESSQSCSESNTSNDD